MTYIIPIVVSLAIGLGLFLVGRYAPDLRVNKWEFVLGLGITILVVTLPVNWIGNKLAVDSATDGFKEYWNGSMVSALSSQTECYRDGACSHEYNCDPYTVYETVIDYDSKGNVSGSHTESHTEYHDCPYVTVEYHYWVNDSFGETPWRETTFAKNPRPWRDGHSIPDGVYRGVPPYWQQVRDAIARNDAPPVTKVNEYTNYLLASTNTILRRYSADIARYQKLLPEHTQNYKDALIGPAARSANKVVTAGITPPNLAAWNTALMHFNAELGTKLQGDMHIVLVAADKVEPDPYINAVMAHWQDTKVFGKWALGKNAIVLAVGLQDNQIVWARTKTGMPVDNNGAMTTAVSLLEYPYPNDPTKFLGNPRATITLDKPTWPQQSGGLIENIVLHEHPFVRACMKCKDKGDSGTSFVYLKADVQIPTAAKVWMVIIALLLNFFVWAALYMLPMFEPFEVRQDQYSSVVSRMRRYGKPYGF